MISRVPMEFWASTIRTASPANPTAPTGRTKRERSGSNCRGCHHEEGPLLRESSHKKDTGLRATCDSDNSLLGRTTGQKLQARRQQSLLRLLLR